MQSTPRRKSRKSLRYPSFMLVSCSQESQRSSRVPSRLRLSLVAYHAIAIRSRSLQDEAILCKYSVCTLFVDSCKSVSALGHGSAIRILVPAFAASRCCRCCRCRASRAKKEDPGPSPWRLWGLHRRSTRLQPHPKIATRCISLRCSTEKAQFAATLLGLAASLLHARRDSA